MVIKYYKKRPAIIKAILFDGTNIEEISTFTKQQVGTVTIGDKTSITINYPEGYLVVLPGDFVVQDERGGFYPCRSDIFAKTHEEIQITSFDINNERKYSHEDQQ